MLKHTPTKEPRDAQGQATVGAAEPGIDLTNERTSLSGSLHRLRVAAMIAEAKLVFEWHDSAERSHEAAKLIRQAMYLQTIGEISQAEESAVFSILAFTMPADCDAGR